MLTTHGRIFGVTAYPANLPEVRLHWPVAGYQNRRLRRPAANYGGSDTPHHAVSRIFSDHSQPQEQIPTVWLQK
jgi:hypothetical protein